MKFLIENGCQLNLRNALGDTPLHRAAWRNQREAVQVFFTEFSVIVDLLKCFYKY